MHAAAFAPPPHTLSLPCSSRFLDPPPTCLPVPESPIHLYLNPPPPPSPTCRPPPCERRACCCRPAPKPLVICTSTLLPLLPLCEECVPLQTSCNTAEKEATEEAFSPLSRSLSDSILSPPSYLQAASLREECVPLQATCDTAGQQRSSLTCAYNPFLISLLPSPHPVGRVLAGGVRAASGDVRHC